MAKELTKDDLDPSELGEYIYMGMAKCKGETVVISVAYKIDYCVEKALKFASLDSNISFYKVNKVLVGKLIPECSFDIPTLLEFLN